jgi:AraC-like DNA-binding protein/CheY-like chemotaxis protein/ligand-binding sensor domain-containing protein
MTTQVTIELLPMLPTSAENGVSYIRFQADGRATMGASYGLYSFNWQHPAGMTKDSVFSRSSLDFHTLHHDEKQDIWFAATRDNIVAWKQGVLKTIALPKINNFRVNFDAIDSATMAISATNYLWLMSPAELFAQDSLSARNAFVTLPPNTYQITKFLKDQTGNLWIGTGGYGLRKFNPKIKRFKAYLPNTSLAELYTDRQGRVYTRHQYAYQLLDRTNDQMGPFLDKKLPAADQRQRFLMQDRRGTFWVSNVNFETHEATLFKFSTDWKLLKKYPLPPGTAFGFVGNQTLEGQTGYLWIGAANGKLLRFNPTTETFAVFSYHNLIPGGSEGLETYALHQDAAGTLWIGTQKGLIRASNLLATPTFSLYKNSLTDRQSLSYDFVSSMVDDPYQPNRYLWIGTKGGGLNQLDKQTGHFLHITEAQGLPNKVVYGILTDQFKNFWISTNRGLAELNPKTFRFRNYTKGDGLQDDEFNTSSFVKLPSGELLFGGINGLTAFQPSELLTTKTRQPIVNIVSLKINNESITVGGSDGILTASIDHTQRIDLAYDQNLLTLEFGVMDYTNPAQNQYRYRLSGIDPDWVDAGTNRFTNYAQLPIGTYTFEMMGSADGQVWSKPVELQVRIHPPFYRTWWAYLFYALVRLEKAIATMPDIVICDLMMPRLNGFGFCQALKTQETTSHIPVMMLTAKAAIDDMIQGFELGADAYLTKPFNRAEIQARVRNLVEQRERLYRRFKVNDAGLITGQKDPKPPLPTAEQTFIDRLTAIVVQHINETDFTVEVLSEDIGMSRVQLHRKLKAIADCTTTNFIRDIRLAKAAELLAAGEERVTQVAYAVGFESLSYFARVFQERYGVRPSQYGRATNGRSTDDKPASVADWAVPLPDYLPESPDFWAFFVKCNVGVNKCNI